MSDWAIQGPKRVILDRPFVVGKENSPLLWERKTFGEPGPGPAIMDTIMDTIMITIMAGMASDIVNE